MTVTTEQALKEQRERHGAIVPAAKLPATGNGGGGGLSAYLAKHDVGSGGTFLKFSKDGKFVRALDGEEVPPDTEMVCPFDETLGGWIKFQGKGEQPIRHMGPVVRGYIPPDRDTLGDTDESLWDTDLSGRPADPWQHQLLLPLVSQEDGERYIFTTSSITGRRAVLSLLKACQRKQAKEGEDSYPIIKLQVGGFAHRDSRVGWVKVPAFPVIGKAPRDDYSQGTTEIGDDLNDAIPF